MEEIKKETDNKVQYDVRKILIVIAEHIARDGVPIFIKNMLSHMDTSKFLIHLYAPGNIVSQSILEDFLELGIVVYVGNRKEEDDVRKIAKRDISILMKKHQYDIVHCNTGKVWLNYYCCCLGVENNIPVRIVHSHSALLPRYNPKIQQQDDEYRKYILEHATYFLTCSKEAAEWLFGKEFKDYLFFRNGIDLERYRFNAEIRAEYRTEFNIKDKFVIGHVGRFVEAKNHIFLLEIFKEITEYYHDSILLMAGVGELLEEVQNKAKNLDIEDKCLFLGERDDVPKLLQAMDVFVFPSLHEGLPITLIEAQAAGLPCIISKEITEEVCLTKNVLQMSLDSEEPATCWAKQILKYHSENTDRACHVQELEEAGYSVSESANRLYNLYTI